MRHAHDDTGPGALDVDAPIRVDACNTPDAERLSPLPDKLEYMVQKALPIFFMHIAKTAGSSMNDLFVDFYKERSITHIEGKPNWHSMLGNYSFFSGHVRYPVFKSIVRDREFLYVSLLREPVTHLRSHMNWIRILMVDPKFAQFIANNPEIKALSELVQDVDLDDADQIKSFLVKSSSMAMGSILFDNCQSRYFVKAPAQIKFSLGDFRRSVANFAEFDFVGISENFIGSVKAMSKKFELDLPLKDIRSNTQTYNKDVDLELFRSKLAPYIGYDCALYDLARSQD